jgi:ubiquitin-like protein Pup
LKQEKKKHAKKVQEEVLAPEAEQKNSSAHTEETDDLLDEIDQVLEKNAAEFVEQYVQKGGE